MHQILAAIEKRGMLKYGASRYKKRAARRPPHTGTYLSFVGIHDFKHIHVVVAAICAIPFLY